MLRRRGRTAQRDPGPRAAARRNTRTGLLLVSPALAFVAVFALFPLGFGIYISLTNWPLIGSYHFTGASNYAALGKDPGFVHSVLFTLLYGIVALPGSPGVRAILLCVIFAFGVARACVTAERISGR